MYPYSYNYGDIYGHYKTNYEPNYIIICKAFDEKTLEEGVVYSHDNKIWFRTIKDFESCVSECTPRFKLIVRNPTDYNIH